MNRRVDIVVVTEDVPSDDAPATDEQDHDAGKEPAQ
jgi:hypothetical protein